MALRRKKPAKNHNSKAKNAPFRKRRPPEHPGRSKTAQVSSDRKKTESALRATEAQLSNAMKLARLGHWEYDVASDTFTFNDQFYAMLHTTAEEIGGYKMLSGDYAQRFVHPDDMSVVGEEIRKALETDDSAYSCQLEHRIIYGDGETGYITVRIFILKDEQGRTIKTYGVIQDITGLKRAENAVWTSEELLKSYIENAGDPIYVVETGTGRIHDCNERACHDLGYRKEDLLQLHAKDIESRLTSGEIDAIHHDLKPGEVKTIDGFHRRKDGSVFPVEIRLNSLAPAQPNLMLSIARDITERKRTEEAVRESELRFRTLIEQAPVAIVVSRIGKILYSNKHFREMMRIPGDETSLGKPVIEYFAPERREESLERTRRRAQGLEVPQEFESVMLRSDGSQFPIHAAVSQVQLSDGPANVTFITDITERKRVEDAVIQSEEKFSNIFHNNPILMVISRLSDGRIVDANPAFLERLGYQRNEVIGRRSVELGIWAEPLDREKLMHVMYAPGPMAHVEAKFRTRSGQIFPVLASVKHITIAGEGHVLSISADITERKQLEEELVERESRLSALFDSAGYSISVARNGVQVHGNPAFMRLFGYNELPEVVGKSVVDGIAPEERDRIGKYIADRAKGLEVPTHYETKGIRKDGTVFDMDVRISTYVYKNEIYTVGFQSDITERKKIEGYVRESEIRYRRLFENSIVGMFQTTPQGGLIKVNLSYAQMFGYKNPDEIIADVKDIGAKLYAHSEQRLEVTRLLNEKGVVEPREYEVVRRDGTKFWVLLSAQEVRDGDGKLLYYEGTNIDITERKRTEEELRRKEQQQALVLDSLPMAFYTSRATEDLATTWISKQVQSLVGHAPDMFVQDSMFWTKHLHPEDRDRVLKALSGVFKVGSADVEYRWQCADGEYRWFRDHLTMAYDREGNPVEAVGIWLEISESKRVELTLREREEKFRNLFNNAEVGMFRTRLDGSEILEFNEKYLSILGYSRDDIMGKSSKSLWADNTERERMIELLNAHDHVTDFECGILNKHGEVRRCITSLRLYRDTGVLEGSIHDITERKKAEEEVKRKTEDLSLLNALNAAANRGDSLQKILTLLAERTKEIFHSSGATVYLASDDGKQLILQKLSIPDDLTRRIEQVIGITIPQIRIALTEKSVHRQILRDAKPKIINDPETIQTLIAEFTESEALHKHVPAIFSLLEMRSVIAAPLMSGNSLFGMTAIARKVPFTEIDLERMGIIAEDLSALLQRRKSEEELRLSQAQLHALAGHLQSVREDERTNLAREMHDELGQLLTGLKMDLSLLDKNLKNAGSAPPEKWRNTKIDTMNKLVDKAIDAVRGISLELRPAILDSLGLSAALEWLANDFQEKSGIVCTCSLKSDEVFDHQCSTAIFRIAQEALTNVVRHSKAKKVIIALESSQAAISLTVRDDGIGMTSEQISDVRSLGLLGIRERAIAIGGTITIDSKIGAGTTITLEVPLSGDNGVSTTGQSI